MVVLKLQNGTMKSKVFVEVLRTQLEKSLVLLSTQFESMFFLQEKENIQVEEKLAYGLQLVQVLENGQERRLWLRRYEIKGSVNDVKAAAFSELFDIIIGNFLVNASRTDDKTLEALSNNKQE